MKGMTRDKKVFILKEEDLKDVRKNEKDLKEKKAS